MKLSVEFVPYILEQRTREIIEFLNNNKTDNDELKLAMLHEVIEVITSYTSPSTEITWLATISFRKIKGLLGNDDPYRNIKKKEIDLSKNYFSKYVLPLIGKKESVEEKLLLLFKASAIADSINLLGYYNGDVESEFKKIEDIALYGYNIRDFVRLIENKKIGYILNNAGEVVFDLEIARIFAEEYGAHVKIFVKTEAYTNDITYRDLLENFDLPNQLHVVPLNTDAAGVDRSLLKKTDFEEIMDNDLIFAKGTMNYCGLHNSGLRIPMFVLLKVSSYTVSKKLGIPRFTPILVILNK